MTEERLPPYPQAPTDIGLLGKRVMPDFSLGIESKRHTDRVGVMTCSIQVQHSILTKIEIDLSGGLKK